MLLESISSLALDADGYFSFRAAIVTYNLQISETS